MAGALMEDEMKNKTLNLNDPADARRFITEALPEALPNRANVNFFILEDGRKISTKTLSDSEAVQYAFELLPIFQAAFPDNCDIKYEH